MAAPLRGDPGIAGKTIRLRDQPYTVVGVLPPAFAVLESGVDVVLPLGLVPGDARAANNRYLMVIARRRGSLEQVRSNSTSWARSMEQALPALDQGWRPSVFELRRRAGGRRAPRVCGCSWPPWDACC